MDARTQRRVEELRRWMTARKSTLCRQGYVQASDRRARLRWRMRDAKGCRLESRWLPTAEEAIEARRLLQAWQRNHRDQLKACRSISKDHIRAGHEIRRQAQAFAREHFPPTITEGHRRRCMRLVRQALSVPGGVEALLVAAPWNHPPKRGRPRKPVLYDRWVHPESEATDT